MVTIKVTGETSAPPERVLEAGTDFSEWRAEVWPNVTTKRLEVHESGDTFADVTEGTWVVGVFGSGAATTGRSQDRSRPL
jgi:hypothetical protein